MTKIKEVSAYLEQFAPLNYQEEYDNSGLIVGDENIEVSQILITLDVTEEVINEAIAKKANLIISHHPIIFKGLKKINGKNYIERSLILAIKHDIAIYAIHTKLDNITNGVNYKIAEKLGLKNVRILNYKQQTLLKLVVFVPIDNKAKLLAALHAAGAGNIGNYQKCSFTTEGDGAFMPIDGANPVIGEVNKMETVLECKIEVILPVHLQGQVLETMRLAHPYEEIAYFLTKLENLNQEIGSGVLGELENEMNEADFLNHLKSSMNLNVIKYTPFGKHKIKKIALCGGTGSFLLKDAIKAGADSFVTADYKYHEFFDAENKILIADIGHYESEVFTKELIHFQLSKKFTNFASLLSETNTNPIKYYI